jgi:uncharacterized protein YacL
MEKLTKKQVKPRGKKLLKNLTLSQKYWILGATSALMIGTGLAVLCESALLKYANEPFVRWFMAGTFSFVLIITGLGLLQMSTRFRVLMDVPKIIKKELKRKAKKEAKKKIKLKLNVKASNDDDN